MRRCLLLLPVALACRAEPPRIPAAPAPPPPPAPLQPSAAAPLAAAPASTETVAIDVTNLDQPFGDHHAIRIDRAGVAHTPGHPSFSPENAQPVALPFSQPVVEVVFVAHVARKPVPGAATGVVYCARTRSAQLECVTDYQKSHPEGRTGQGASYVFAAVNDGKVTHVATSRGATTLVCARIERGTKITGSCWTPSHDGRQLEPVKALDAEAIGVATKIPAQIATAWEAADRDASIGKMIKTVVSNRQDDTHVLPDGTNPATWCALLDSGVLTCYGPGIYGELGDGKLDATPRATRPLGNTRVADITLRNHTVCAATDAGKVACWGDVYGAIPVASGTKRARLPVCALDRAASRARYDRAKQEIEQRTNECNRSCDANPVRDCHLSCTPACNPEPYIFDHRVVCQEPSESMVRSEIPRHLPEPCSSFGRTPQWLTDAQLKRVADDTELVLSPAHVTGIADAVRVVLSGANVCALTRTGAVTCTGWR